MKYKVVCKCRMCGEEFQCRESDEDSAFFIQGTIVFLPKSMNGGVPPYHICDNGDIGFGELIGCRKVDKE